MRKLRRARKPRLNRVRWNGLQFKLPILESNEWQKANFNLTVLLIFVVLTCYVFVLTLWASTTSTHKYSDIKYEYTQSFDHREVILFGYLRGGTTFLGEVLGNRFDVFYVYEPLHKLSPFDYFDNGQSCSIMAPRCKPSQTKYSSAKDAINGIFSCNSQIFTEHLGKWQFPFLRSFKCRNYDHKCVKDIQNQCRRKKNMVVKFARMQLRDLEYLLKSNNHLRIIFYIRDPRAIVSSRLRVKWKGFNSNLTNISRALCHKMLADIQSRKYLEELYPGKIKTVFYEKIAMDPEGEIRKIFDFIGWKFTKMDSNKIKRLTDNPENRALDILTETRRENSLKTSMAWRTRLNESEKEQIEVHCLKIIDMLGYSQ